MWKYVNVRFQGGLPTEEFKIYKNYTDFAHLYIVLKILQDNYV